MDTVLRGEPCTVPPYGDPRVSPCSLVGQILESCRTLLASSSVLSTWFLPYWIVPYRREVCRSRSDSDCSELYESPVQYFTGSIWIYPSCTLHSEMCPTDIT